MREKAQFPSMLSQGHTAHHGNWLHNAYCVLRMAIETIYNWRTFSSAQNFSFKTNETINRPEA
jgi:hypothetical protein